MIDPVSQLPDRGQFFEELNAQQQYHDPNMGVAALLVVNLHRFREINETFGYTLGDELLRTAGQRIRQAVRGSDFVARLGSDEFGVLLPCILSAEHAGLAASKILETIQQAMTLDGKRFRVRASIGIALYPEHGQQAADVLACAEQALVKARSTHQPQLIYDRPAPAGEASLLVEHQLEQALQSGDLVLHLQPKVDLRSANVCGVEALSRLSHQQHGLIQPDRFVPVAEDTGLITPLSLWALNAALRHCAENSMARHACSVAVNLSACVLNDPDVVDLVDRALRIWGVPAPRLVLEITETAMMMEPERSLETLQGLRDLGVNLSIDDFGTGYSSLAYLRRLPVNELKIDKSFVSTMVRNPGDAKIVRSIIDLAHAFDLTVVAEGVEDQATLEQLSTMGCDIAQGYFIARPMPMDDLEQWFEESLWCDRDMSYAV